MIPDGSLEVDGVLCPYKCLKHAQIYAKGYWSGIRRVVLGILGDKCVRCGETYLPDLEIDHIIPMEQRSRSITNLFELSNLQILCTSCNKTKGDKTI